jgi:hypothetical protein
MSDTAGKLQQVMFREYARSVGLSPDARYYGGARLRPVVPLDIAIGGYFVIGAYPSAQFESVEGENDVPVGDNLGPFEPQVGADIPIGEQFTNLAALPATGARLCAVPVKVRSMGTFPVRACAVV